MRQNVYIAGNIFALAQVNHAIQHVINVSGYNSPSAKLSKNTTLFFCKVDCCNILRKYAI
jgi:hypothetical protein